MTGVLGPVRSLWSPRWTPRPLSGEPQPTLPGRQHARPCACTERAREGGLNEGGLYERPDRQKTVCRQDMGGGDFS